MESLFLKVILAGDGGVGKTTLLYRYVEDRFMNETKMTLGVDFMVKELIIKNYQVMLQIWDFGGQDHFRHLLHRYVLGARGAVLMFDLTRITTLESTEEWVNICRTYDQDLPIIYLGTKYDLQELIMVDNDLALNMKEKFNFIDYIKTSSKTGRNIEDAFEQLTLSILKRENLI